MASKKFVVDWNSVLGSNRSAVRQFADGQLSYRGLARELGNAEARSVVWSMERHLPVSAARRRAKSALSR